MDREAIRVKVQEILRDVTEDDEVVIGDDTLPEDVADWDSANQVRVMLAIEEDFRVSFDNEELDVPESVGHLLDLIQLKLAA